MNKFRNATNTLLTKSLFLEVNVTEPDLVVYTLGDVDKQGFPSLYRLYMETDDLTEYEFATQFLDGWEHWQKLVTCNWFVPYIIRWRQELELRTRARALRALKLEALEGKYSYQANKILLEGGWKEKSSSSRGRPSKDEIDKKAIIEAEKAFKVKADYERILS